MQTKKPKMVLKHLSNDMKESKESIQEDMKLAKKIKKPVKK